MRLLLLLLPALGLLAGEAQTVTLTDVSGRGFPPDLVTWAIAPPADGGKGLRVFDAEGKPVPAQTAQDGKQTLLAFVAAVPAKGSAVFTIRSDGQGPAAPPAVTATREGEALVLANQLVAVRVPAPQERTFASPVAAATLPPPILAFRGPDGTWKGAGGVLAKRPVRKLTVAQTAAGPVYAETSYRLDYADGGWFQATVRVTDRAPFARVREEFDLGSAAPAADDAWVLDLCAGWQPDAVEHMSVAGQGHGQPQYPSVAAEAKTVAAGPSVGADFPGGGSGPVRAIHHDSCWGAKYVSFYGVHAAAARKADPNRYPLALVAPLHMGDWRRSASLPVFITDGAVRVAFPVAVRPTSWQDEPRSDVSPFSCHEHDPALPATYGRRTWALVLAPAPLRIAGYGEQAIAASDGYAIRCGYGLIGLDRIKDYVLAWPDGKPAYPRVFITPEEVAKYRAAAAKDATFANLNGPLSDYYWFTGEAATAQKELPAVLQGLDRNIAMALNEIQMGHHHTLEMYGKPIGHAESVLSWPDLPAADRQAVRSRLALLCYLLTEPDVTSAGNGSHHGNPNMGVSRLSDRSNLIALLPDHPMHAAWSRYVGAFLSYKQGTFMAPGGGWFEYGASYHMHGYGKILRGLMGALADAVPEADLLWRRHRQDLDYYLNLLSPVDPRYGARTIPGMANSPVGNPPHYVQAMGTVAAKDPAFAGNLLWAWNASGRMQGTGGDGITIPAMARPAIPPQQPALESRSYPGFGVIFRAHPGPDETCLYLRSGYLWSHWNQDQGNLVCYAKGAVLLPPQPYQYGGPKDQAFPDKNLLRFGAPVNDLPHDWADSNVLDSRFGPSVDYAWASSGYPDWFIQPGYRPGFGKPRELAAVDGQQQGAFTWDRQVMFLKSAQAKGANYFVIRDSMAGEGRLASWFNLSLLGRQANVAIDGGRVALDSEWPTKLELLFTGRDKPAFELRDDDLTLAFGAYSKFSGDLGEGKVPSRDWVKDGKPVAVGTNAYKDMQNAKEQHVALRLANAPGQEVAWVLFPRGPGEAAPTATQLAPGVTKVVTAEGTDYVFLATTPLIYSGEGIEFAGTAGAVRVPKAGAPELLLLRGSRLAFQGKAVADPAAAEPQVTGGTDKPTNYSWRFVAPAGQYVNLTRGNVGVRGMGPFDLTFTPDGIRGTVDGDVRTIVTTWPERIVRPGYAMDGERWYAGFSDEHSFVKGTTSPQFAIAIGVTAGKHTVAIGEWEWPALPTPPARTALSLR